MIIETHSIQACVITGGGCSAATDAETNVSNVRRENKLYSYKEQMADIELRRVSCFDHQLFLVEEVTMIVVIIIVNNSISIHSHGSG